MDTMSSDNESDAETMLTDMLDDILDGSQSNPIINRRDARNKIRDLIKQGQVEWKGALLSTQNMGKVYTNYLRLWLMLFLKPHQFWVNLSQKFLISFCNLETL